MLNSHFVNKDKFSHVALGSPCCPKTRTPCPRGLEIFNSGRRFIIYSTHIHILVYTSKYLDCLLPGIDIKEHAILKNCKLEIFLVLTQNKVPLRLLYIFNFSRSILFTCILFNKEQYCSLRWTDNEQHTRITQKRTKMAAPFQQTRIQILSLFMHI